MPLAVTSVLGRFFSANRDGDVRLWDLSADIPILEASCGRLPRAMAVREVGDSFELAIGRLDGCVSIISMSNPESSRTVPLEHGAVHDVAWVGEHILAATESGALVRVHGDQLAASPVAGCALQSLAVHSNGEATVLGLQDGSVQLREDWWSGGPGSTAWRGKEQRAYRVRWSGTDRLVAVLGSEIVIGDANLKSVQRIPVRGGASNHAAFAAAWSPDSNRLCFNRASDVVVCSDEGNELFSHSAHDDVVSDLGWTTPDVIVSIDRSGALFVWPLGEEPRRLEG